MVSRGTIHGIKNPKCNIINDVTLTANRETFILNLKMKSIIKTNYPSINLANQLAKKIDPETIERINSFDLAQVSQYYDPGSRGRGLLEATVTSFFIEKKGLCSELHQLHRKKMQNASIATSFRNHGNPLIP